MILQALVLAFHKAFGLPAPSKPEMPSPEQRLLRARLIFEEALEYVKAAGVLVIAGSPFSEIWIEDVGDLGFYDAADTDPDEVGMIDALCDLASVTLGGAVIQGIDLAPFFADVHASNMAKLHDGKVVLDEGGKVVKPAGWKPPDLAARLAALKEQTR